LTRQHARHRQNSSQYRTETEIEASTGPVQPDGNAISGHDDRPILPPADGDVMPMGGGNFSISLENQMARSGAISGSRRGGRLPRGRPE
jgi:hypothetical protein